MRLLRAELLKIRRRQATWVILFVTLLLMAAIYLATGSTMGMLAGSISFPAAYGLIGEFAFGLGGLMAVVFAATIVGADWNWGVLRNVVARGESRANYLLAKATALAIALAIGMLIIFAAGLLLTFVTAWLNGVRVSSPLRGRGLLDLVDWLLLGYPVLLQRAALGFAVAVVLRSQLAGAVVGIVLYVGEAVVTTTLTVATLAGRFGGVFNGGGDGFQPIGPEWFQFLPISIGGNVLNAAPGGTELSASRSIEDFFLRSVPVELALPLVVLYAFVVLGVAILALQRQEIV